MIKKILSFFFIFTVLTSCCGFAFADTIPTTNTKLKITNVQIGNLVLNVATENNVVQDTAVTLWGWENNSTQWWKTSYYATIGGVATYTLPLYSYPTLMLNDYHPSAHYCTIYTATNNSYEDITFNWYYLQSGSYLLYLYSYNRYLGSPDALPNTQCRWVSCPNGASDYQKWSIIVNP